MTTTSSGTTFSASPVGFPSPAEDYIEHTLDLNQLLIKHPAATFFGRANGDSLIDAGIHSGDVLVVDRSLKPVVGSVVVAVMDAELVVKRLPAPSVRSAPDTSDDTGIQIWGVVTHAIHQL